MIITYYWPPASSVGVRRWLRFAEILPEYHIDPIIVCPSNADYPMTSDETKEERDWEKIEVPIFEWRRWYKKLVPSGRKRGINQKNKIDGIFYEDRSQLGLRRKLMLWIRANVIVPDARASWINPCATAIHQYLENHDVDLIVSTGPPHSCHRIARKVKQKHPDIPWLADFRDPWTGGSYFSLLPLTNWGLRRHQRMEREVLETADRVLTVSWAWADDFKRLGAKQVDVITNGYDQHNFEPPIPRSDQYIMSHVGTMYGDRNSAPFWRALAKYLNENSDFAKRFTMRLIGRVGPQIKELVEELQLQDKVEFVGVVDHLTAVREMQLSNALLLIVNNTRDFAGRIPAKVFEYLASTRPILLLGPENGDIHRIIEDGLFFVPMDENKQEVFLEKLEAIFKSDFVREKGMEKYERGQLTADLVDIIHEMIAGPK